MSNSYIFAVMMIFSCETSSESKSYTNNPNHQNPDNNLIETIHSNVKGFDGFSIDSEGNFILAHGWTNSTVGKLTKEGTYSTIGQGLSGPVVIALNRNDDVFVTNFTGHYVSKISKDGVIENYASGFDTPAAIAFDSNDQLFVGNYGFDYRGNEIKQVNHDRSISTFIESEDIIAPIDLVFDDQDNLYIANQVGGAILKYDNNTITVLAKAPTGNIGHMIYFQGALYITSGKFMYKIDLEGRLTFFAGHSTRQYQDGELKDAGFRNLNGIATDGVDIYVADIAELPGKSNIRKITLSR
jgi:sugar lactone lactonase YvrE